MVQILLGRNSGKSGAGSKLALLVLDACTEQEPNYKNQITRFPVEVGVDVSDHVRMEPDTIKIGGQISNTPDTTLVTAGGNRLVNAYEVLLAISGRSMLRSVDEYIDEFPGPIMVDLIGLRQRVMVDMICEDFQPPVDVQTGDVINFTMLFTKVRFATTSLSNISYSLNKIADPNTADAVNPGADYGKQQTGNPSDAVTNALNGGAKSGVDWLMANDVSN